MNVLQLRNATRADWPHIAQFLTDAGLPLTGAADHLHSFILAFAENTLVGTAALERYDDAALLRSVAVERAVRHHGIGQQLVQAALERARHEGITNVYLLTETAQGFFPRFDFRPIDRANVPATVQQSVEFAETCPASATVMVASLA